MSYESQIQNLEIKIRELGHNLCAILAPLPQPYPSFLAFVKMRFSGNRYPKAISDLKWFFKEHNAALPETALSIWQEINNKADEAKHLYELKRQSDDGHKDPITHMNVLMEAGDDIPDEFSKRYGLYEGEVKCLWLVAPGFEERFIRERIGNAVARNGARSGHYIFTKRRYRLTYEQAQRLVDEIWDNPKAVSQVFHELLNWEKLVSCRLSKEHQKEVRHIKSRFQRII